MSKTKTKYYEIDNTPEVGRVNTFLVHSTGLKGYVHFFNVDISPNPVVIKDVKKYGTQFYILKLFVKSSTHEKQTVSYIKEHYVYNVDTSSIEVIPIHIPKRLSTSLIKSVLKGTGYCSSGGAPAIEKLHKVIYECLNQGIDISDCCRRITRQEYESIIKAKEKELAEKQEEINSILREAEKRKKENGKKTIVEKYYSKDDHLFHIKYRIENKYLLEEETVSSFEEFYQKCNRNLFNADLLDYDFDGVDLSRYNFESAIINSETMIRLGTYSDFAYRRIKQGKEYASFTPSNTDYLVPDRMKYSVSNSFSDYEKTDDLFLYISDLHINHKLIKKFSEKANPYEIERYFDEIIKQLATSIPHSYRTSIFIIGDVSFDFYFFVSFFNRYRKYITSKTFFIIGNHDLWDKKLCNECNTFDEMVSRFKKILEPLNINVLESEMYVPHVLKDSEFKKVYTSQELLEMPAIKIRELFKYNSYAILGGMGFAGLNNNFNCNNGIYRDAPITREYEIKQSKLLSDVHEKLKDIIPDKKLIVVTHMPFSDWCSGKPVQNWVYVSGHTHKNNYIESDEMTMYADNQIGYENSSFGFKFFSLKPFFNIFEDYPEGVHEITRQDYSIFCYGFGDRASFNRQFTKLYLLKRKKTYLFLIQLKEGGPLYLLNGGAIKGTYGRGIQYFYDRMINYAKSVSAFLKHYSDYQKRVSGEIKRIGGDGTIHGCIVDIDFYNHIYINPLDGTITPYNALNMVWKDVYSNLASLLKFCVPHLYDNFISLLSQNDNGSTQLTIAKDMTIDKKTIFVPETDMYRISRIIKALQYTTQFNIIRLWNYAIADDVNEENGRLIVSGIIDPESMPEVEDISRPKRIKKDKIVKEIEPRIVVPKKTYYEKHQEKVEAQSGGTVELLNLPDSKTDATLRCTICNHTWKQRIDHFYRYPRCPKCNRRKKYNTVL